MAAVGLTGIEDDQPALGALVDALVEAGEDDAANVLRFSTLTWWTELNEELGVALGSDYAQWYPEHFAALIVPFGTPTRSRTPTCFSKRRLLTS